MYSVYFIRKNERSETTLRYSAVHYSTVLRFAFYAPCPMRATKASALRAGINDRSYDLMLPHFTLCPMLRALCQLPHSASLTAP